MARQRLFPCRRPGCRKLAYLVNTFCSTSCNRSFHLAQQTPEQRRVMCNRIRSLQWAQDINRMLLRVKALADTEDARLVLAWRYGKSAAKSARYRRKVRTGVAA